MKLIVGYDGSACANDAIADLDRAGLPSQAEAVVFSAADVWPPRPQWTYDELPSAKQERMPLSERAAYELAMTQMRTARAAVRDSAMAQWR